MTTRAARNAEAASMSSRVPGSSNQPSSSAGRYQEYSNWLAEMVHGASGSPVGGGGSFRERIMRTRLERLLSSDTAARYYAETFTGLG